MPNDCWNSLLIYGPKKLLEEIKEHNFSFQHFVPMPEEEKENWYDWKLENWGTKWDSHDVTISEGDEHSMRVYYTTAWDPPHAFLEKFLEKYPKCFLKNTHNSEDGSAGVWVARYKDGEKYIQKYHWEELCLEEMISFIPPSSTALPG